jgi:hypothetical protein
MHYEEEEISRKSIVVFNWTIDCLVVGNFKWKNFVGYFKVRSIGLGIQWHAL